MLGGNITAILGTWCSSRPIVATACANVSNDARAGAARQRGVNRALGRAPQHLRR
jgi:hypothetical protein